MKSHRMNPAGLHARKRCRKGRLHTICLNSKGQLGMLDHSHADLAREDDWQELGGRPCGCVQVLETWKRCMLSGKRRSGLPLAFVPYCEDCIGERKRRKQLRKASQPTVATQQSIQERAPTILEAALHRLLEKELKMPPQRWLTVFPEESGWFPIRLKYPFPRYTRWDSIGVARNWVSTIYKPGLAIVEGGLTLALFPATSEGTQEALQLIRVRGRMGIPRLQKRRLVISRNLHDR